MRTFEYRGATYHVREQLGGDVIKSPHLYVRIINAVYGGEITLNDTRIIWEMVFAVRDVLLRVTAMNLGEDAPIGNINITDRDANNEAICEIWQSLENAPVEFVRLLMDSLEDAPDPNATSTPTD